MKKSLAIVLALIMTLMLVPTAAFAETIQNQPSEVEPDQPKWDMDISKSKTATQLENDESTITLSLPSAQETLASDVVFVLDKSSCKEDTANKAGQMLEKLQEEVNKNKSNIQIGVIVFGGDAKVSYPLSAFPTTETELGELKKALTTRPEGLMGGSNMHAGLLAAQGMLESSTTDNNRKYVILVSDGLTRLFTGADGKTKDIYYQYYYSDKTGKKQVGTESGQIHPKDCVYFGMIGEWVNVRTQSESDSNYVIPYGNWDTYFSNVKEWVKADGDTYALDYETYGNDPTKNVKKTTDGEITDPAFKYIGHNDYENHAMSVDRAVYEAYKSFTGMVDSGYHCYAVLSGNGTEFGKAFMGAMNKHAGNGDVDFASIGNEILYAVGAGSTVEDKMGSDFDLVQGTFKLTVGGKEVTGTPDSTTGKINFGTAKTDGSYPYSIEYTAATKTFTWTINENVSNFAPVQLTYKVKLVNKSTVSGTYTPPTNEYAKLTPKSSDGKKGNVQEFNKPTVSYTVSGGGHSHYYPVATPVPVAVVLPKTGDMTIWQSILHFFGIM